MSEHQTIIYIVAVAIVTILIGTGFRIFADAHVASHRDDFISTMNTISSDASHHKRRPERLGGGGGKFNGFKVPEKLEKIPAGRIFAVVEPTRIFLVGHSDHGYGSVTAVINLNGELSAFAFEGDFQ